MIKMSALPLSEVPECYPAGQPTLAVVVPLHNSEGVITQTVEAWMRFLPEESGRLMLVENGSSDATWERCCELQDRFGQHRVVALRSEKGMGNALDAGILASTEDYVLLSADDLPFGFTDVAAAVADNWSAPILIGSKAHPKSEIGRSRKREVISSGFRLARRAILFSGVGDSQGTFIIEGSWARKVAPKLKETGFLFTTELVYAAERQKIPIMEMPVQLADHHGQKRTSISKRDVIDMGLGLLRIRGRRRSLRKL